MSISGDNYPRLSKRKAKGTKNMKRLTLLTHQLISTRRSPKRKRKDIKETTLSLNMLLPRQAIKLLTFTINLILNMHPREGIVTLRKKI